MFKLKIYDFEYEKIKKKKSFDFENKGRVKSEVSERTCYFGRKKS